jgi:hypothetical protein
MPVFIIKFKCKPNPSATELSEFGGAYINCWVEETQINNAIDLASEKVKENNWSIIRIEDKFQINKDDLTDDSQSLEYFEQTLIDKWLLNIHTYPKK